MPNGVRLHQLCKLLAGARLGPARLCCAPRHCAGPGFTSLCSCRCARPARCCKEACRVPDSAWPARRSGTSRTWGCRRRSASRPRRSRSPRCARSRRVSSTWRLRCRASASAARCGGGRAEAELAAGRCGPGIGLHVGWLLASRTRGYDRAARAVAAGGPAVGPRTQTRASASAPACGNGGNATHPAPSPPGRPGSCGWDLSARAQRVRTSKQVPHQRCWARRRP